MSLKSSLRIKATTSVSGGQQGGVSPFMFGMLVGMSVLSVMSSYQARKELDKLQKVQAERAARSAEDTVKALEFAAMTETRSTYSEDFTMERAKANMAMATGKTRGGEEYVLNAQQETEEGRFGMDDQKIAVTASDDTLLRAKVYQTGSAADLDQLANSTSQVATFDSGVVRDRQVRSSHKAMEALAEQIYAFYAGHGRFPSDSEFAELRAKFPYVDAWGGAFDYIRTSDSVGALEFTTPWNYTQSLNLSLKDE